MSCLPLTLLWKSGPKTFTNTTATFEKYSGWNRVVLHSKFKKEKLQIISVWRLLLNTLKIHDSVTRKISEYQCSFLWCLRWRQSSILLYWNSQSSLHFTYMKSFIPQKQNVFKMHSSRFTLPYITNKWQDLAYSVISLSARLHRSSTLVES